MILRLEINCVIISIGYLEFNIVKEIKGDVKNQPREDTEKNLSPRWDSNPCGKGWLVGGSFMGETFLAINVTV